MNKQQGKDFIKQTAEDYGLEEWEVEEIYQKHTMDEFYQQLEIIVAERLR